MTIFLTGGTGQVGRKLAELLHASGHSVVIASRSGLGPPSFKIVKFDWFDQHTFGTPFEKDSAIDRVFLVAPSTSNAMELMKPFIDMAISKGVKRFVYITGTYGNTAAHPFGKICDYIATVGVEYAVLRATWFMENFGRVFYHSLRYHNEVASAAEDGRIPFVGTQDVANATYDALVSETCLNADYFVTGPKLYSYQEAVAILSEVLNKTITFKRVSVTEKVNIFIQLGVAQDFAELLALLDGQAARGTEEAIFKNENTVMGKQDLKDYFETNRDLWTA